MIINGKEYSLWPQFIDNKNEWVGGILEELQDSFPQIGNDESSTTEIVDIKFSANGKDSAYFEVIGKDYSCGGDVQYLGVVGGEAEREHKLVSSLNFTVSSFSNKQSWIVIHQCRQTLRNQFF